MAWPIKVARNAPAMPSTVVRRNPLGLFGPGESSRAMMPATKPTMMIQRMPLMLDVLFIKNGVRTNGLRREASKLARHFAFGRQTPFRRQMVDHIRQLLAEAGKQFLARHSGL